MATIQGALSVDINGDTDAAGVSFEVNRIACNPDEEFEPFSHSESTAFADGFQPGLSQDQAADSLQKHVYAELNLDLRPGCYAIAATVLDLAGEPSEYCEGAATEVSTTGGETREVALVGQCLGPQTAAGSVSLTLNHPPEIIDFTVAPSTLLYECQPVEVCITAFDPDNDPIVFDMETFGPAAPFAAPAQVSSAKRIGTSDNGAVWERTACFEMALDELGLYTATSIARDTAPGAGGAAEPIEDLLASYGSSADSRATLDTPFHVHYAVEPVCWAEGMDAARPFADAQPILRAEGCGFTSASEFFCSDGEHDAICDAGEIVGGELYPQCTGDEVVMIDGGGQAMCYVGVDGTPTCWGQAVKAYPAGVEVASLTVTHQQTCGIRPDGVLVCAGGTMDGLEIAGPFIDVDSYTDSVCALDGAGQARCWNGGVSSPAPEGTFTQIGKGSGDRACGLALDGSIECLIITPPEGDGFVQVEVHKNYGCARAANGAVTCFGTSHQPDADSRFRTMSTGQSAACGVHLDGSIECWGNTESWYTPGGFADSYVDVTVTDAAICAVRDDLSVQCLFQADKPSMATPPELAGD